MAEQPMPLRHATGPSFYRSQLLTVLGKGITSRMLPMPVRYMTQPLKAQAEAGVTGGTVLPQVQIEAVILLPGGPAPRMRCSRTS